MKEKTGTYKGRFSRKWILTWIVLILIFSIISISVTGADNNTKGQASGGANPERIININNSTDNIKNTGIINESNIESRVQSNGTESNGSKGVNSTLKIMSTNRTENNRSKGVNSTLKTVLSNNSESNESAGVNSTLKTVSSNNTEGNKSVGVNSKLKVVSSNSTESNETVEDTESGTKNTTKVNEIIRQIWDSISQQLPKDSNSTEDNETVDTELGTKNITASNKTVDNSESETKANNSIESNETLGNNEIGTKNTTQRNETAGNKETGTKANNSIESNETIENNESGTKNTTQSNGTVGNKETGTKTNNTAESNETVGNKETGTKTNNTAESNETVGNKETGTKANNSIESNETIGNKESGTKNTTQSNETVGNSETGTKNTTQSNETVENNESGTKANNSVESNETVSNSDTEIKTNNSVENNETVGNNETGAKESSTVSHKSDGEGSKLNIITSNDTESNETIGDNETGTKESNITQSNESAESNVKLKTEEINETVGNTEPVIKNTTQSNTTQSNKTETQKSTEAKTETEVKGCNYTRILENKKVESQIKIYSRVKSLESKDVKPEITAYNWTYSLENKSVTPEIKADESSWNNLKFILSYPDNTLRSFYTINETVKISYKGPETLGQQNVDIYLIKEHNSSFPENAISNCVNESAVSLEDVLNANTESYIQIPATLNENGDLSPLTVGPLPAGNYWVLITLAENGKEKPESEKGVLLSKYFEVLEYEMEAGVPYTIEEGKNFEVNLNLKNAFAQKNHTYWALLLKEDAYTTSESTNPRWITTGIRPIVNGVDVIMSLETNLTEHESRAGKDKLKDEIQTLVGKENGTINIGEENQSTLSLNSLDLPSGDYLLVAGAYGNNEGLAGIAQEELRISSENSYGLGSSSESRILDSSSSIKNRGSPLMGVKSAFKPPAFMFEDLKPYIKANSLVEVVRNPPKIPSFLLGFAGALLIGLAIMKKKK